MGYRYSDREIEVLKRTEVLMEARRTARLGDAPIDPDRDDYEAIEFLMNIMRDFDEIVDGRDLSIDPLDTDVAREVARGSVPYNDYKAAMAYVQLGLYKYDELEGDTTYAGRPMDGIRYALYTFAVVAVSRMLNEEPPSFF